MAKFLGYERCPKCDDNGRDRRGDNLAVYSDGGAHCFSCGFHRFPLAIHRSIVEKEVNAGQNKRVLPSDFTREVPTAAWKWLLQYGLGWKYWKPFVGWSEKHSRLILTVGGTAGEPISFSMGRLIGRPESKGERKWFVYGDSHTRPHVFGHGLGSSVVLVEDLISAHKVGQVNECIPLFGTRVFPNAIPCLRHLNKPIVMWLDEDQRAQAAKRASSLSMVTGLPVQFVFTKHDPKLLSSTQIEETLNV